MHKRKTKNQSESRLSGVVCILNTRKDRSPKDSQKKHYQNSSDLGARVLQNSLPIFINQRERERDGRGEERLAFD